CPTRQFINGLQKPPFSKTPGVVPFVCPCVLKNSRLKSTLGKPPMPCACGTAGPCSPTSGASRERIQADTDRSGTAGKQQAARQAVAEGRQRQSWRPAQGCRLAQ